MTFESLQSLVSYYVDDINFGYFTLPQVKVFLNNAQREVQKQLVQAGENFYVKCVTTPMIQDQCGYTLPEDFNKTRRVEIVQSIDTSGESIRIITPVTIMEDAQASSTPGLPDFYYLKKDMLVFNCPADATTATYTLRMLYTYMVADMINQLDVPDVPERYQEYIAVLATLDCIYKDGRDPGPWLKKRDDYMSLMKQDSERRTEDAPRMVVSTMDDDWYGIV